MNQLHEVRNLRRGVLARRTPSHCRECEVAMVVRRKGAHPPHAHGGRGYCRVCYNRRRRDLARGGGSRQWRALDLLAEYEFWKQEGLPTKQAVADRIGVQLKTLDRAISRGRAYRRAAEASSRVAEAA